MSIKAYMYNRILYSVILTGSPHNALYAKDDYLSNLNMTSIRVFIHIKDPTKLGHGSWEGVVYGFDERERNAYHVENPGTRRVVGARNNMVFIATTSQ